MLVSACLLGCRCRHDGRDAFRSAVAQAIAGWRVVPVCPEELGGLPTPREPASFEAPDGVDPAEAVAAGAGRLVTPSGQDVTAAYQAGARRVVEIARAEGARRAVLKGKSPSCGNSRVYLGDRLVRGAGLTARALREAGLELEEID